MQAKTIINRAARAAANHDSDTIGRLSFHVGALEVEVTFLCVKLNSFTPVCTGIETTFKTDDGKELVVFYDADEDGFNELLGVYANGFDVIDLLDSMFMERIEEHCIDHAYMLRKQAEYDRGEEQYERRRDAELRRAGERG